MLEQKKVETYIICGPNTVKMQESGGKQFNRKKLITKQKLIIGQSLMAFWKCINEADLFKRRNLKFFKN